MRPARIVVAVVLTAAVTATGSYLAYTSNHRSAAASPTTAPAPSATTTPPTAVTTSTPGVSGAACSSQAILPLLKRKLDSGELVIVRADIKRCRHGYAHVFAISRPNPPGHPQYENEQLFLRDVNGSWHSVAEGTGIACSDADIAAAMLRACRALGYPTPTMPTPTPRIPDPAMAARQVFQAWHSAGYRVVSINAQMRFASPDTAAKYLMGAWLADDRADARNAASDTVIDALWSRLRDRSQPPRFAGCTFRDSDHGTDCAFNTTTVGLGFTMQVKGGALLGHHVVAIRFAQL